MTTRKWRFVNKKKNTHREIGKWEHPGDNNMTLWRCCMLYICWLLFFLSSFANIIFTISLIYIYIYVFCVCFFFLFRVSLLLDFFDFCFRFLTRLHYIWLQWWWWCCCCCCLSLLFSPPLSLSLLFFFFFICAPYRLFHFFPLWNKSHNDSKEQVSFGIALPLR